MARDRLSPKQRSSRARVGAHASWAATPDVAARMAPAHAARFARFERQVDPDGVLDPADRERMAKAAERAYMLGLAAKSARTRARRAS